MDKEFKEKEREVERLRLENEAQAQKTDLAQKKALEKEAKEKYGKDYKKIFGLLKKLPSSEKIMDHFNMGSGQELRDLNNPRRWAGRNG